VLLKINFIQSAAMEIYFTDHFLQQSSATVHYIEWFSKKEIKKNGKTLFFIHGTNQTCHTWDELIVFLIPFGFRIICYEITGHGDSSWSEKYTISELTKEVSETISHLKLENFIICGMSLGGILTLNYASQNPKSKNILGLIIVDITPKVEDTNTKHIRDSVAESHVLDSFEAFIEV
jgi:pimeloyl-ACP methyl ester carboxylesterase